MANCVYLDEMLHAAASHLGLHSLLRTVCLHIVNTVFYDYSQANDVHVCVIYSYAFINFVLASVNAKIDCSISQNTSSPLSSGKGIKGGSHGLWFSSLFNIIHRLLSPRNVGSHLTEDYLDFVPNNNKF